MSSPAAGPSEELLNLYAEELSYLRERGNEFAASYPKIAGRLGIAGHVCADPHVERMLESFAFLSARLRREIEAEFPLITASLLGVLYPQFISPLPASAVATFQIDPRESKLASGYTIEKNTPLFAASSSGPVCKFRTAYPVTLWPVEIKDAALIPPETLDLPASLLAGVAGVLKLRLATAGVPLASLRMPSLRVFIGGAGMTSYRLYELVTASIRRVLVRGEGGPADVYDASVVPVGFGRDEDLLPYPSHAHVGYRLIQEYFTLPEKFLFFDIQLGRLPSSTQGEVLIFFKDKPGGSVAVRPDTFRLGCTPIVNLFPKHAEPIRVDHRRPEYRLVADVRRERTTDIHSIQKVTATAPGEPQEVTYEPFFSFVHRAKGQEPRAYYHARRVPTGRKDIPGTDVVLSFLDLDFKLHKPPSTAVYASVLCTNRDLADEMAADTPLQLERAIPVKRVVCATKPTSQQDPPLGGQALWRLVSNLSLNHLSLSDGRSGADALREILYAHLFTSDPGAERQIDGIASVSCRTVTRRLGIEAWRGFCRGTEVTLTVSEDQFVGSSPILFASVLTHFLSLYAHMNTFTELVLRSTAREEEWKRWPPMAGEKTLL